MYVPVFFIVFVTGNSCVFLVYLNFNDEAVLLSGVTIAFYSAYHIAGAQQMYE